MIRAIFIIAMLLIAALSCSTENTPTYTLTTTASPAEGGEITPNTGTFDEGEAVSLQALPAEGWDFIRWEQDLNATANPMNITMNRDYTVVGVFEQRTHGLTINVEGQGSVKETVLKSRTTDYSEGTVVELEAVPAENWEFSHWEGYLSGSDNPAEITIDTPISIVAVFTTFPTVSTNSVESITENSAQSGGNVTDDGGTSVLARGVCWSTSENPTTNDSCTEDGSGTGSFTSEITGLSSGTQYYVRAYATNAVVTAYGNEINFSTNTEIVDVTNPATGKTWMDRNLGASRVATSSSDSEAYGDYYQWGRAADGHEKQNSGTTSTLSSTDQTGHGNFITTTISPRDWRSPQNDNLWQGVDGINNPCPDGYRLPTGAEWDAERQSWNSEDPAGAFASPLKLPAAGYRHYSDGLLRSSGGRYWSSTVTGTGSQRLEFVSSVAGNFSVSRAFGSSVRCIKD
jgi:uncharacterized protein (TIGR02145 family)